MVFVQWSLLVINESQADGFTLYFYGGNWLFGNNGKSQSLCFGAFNEKNQGGLNIQQAYEDLCQACSLVLSFYTGASG